ncbi:MAG: tRNA dihydrouridine synthase DusB [Betaproteobacteria bacterium]|nr:MAG: tRNA dihydrouridine synthase DusB [Betaproteobacteria bacterium]TMH06553.1 MAG: tRNA dihydrouridine synthase DusB [Betaproteobacteria bacterium]
MHIGSHHIENNLVVAPMAGVTDRPFRQLCKRLGAGLAVSEMVSSDPRLRDTHKSLRRTNHEGEVKPIVVQIAGSDPEWMADAARYNVDRGAQIIDINMGCPAKKVCSVAAGSALLRNEALVAQIVAAVVAAVAVPVTLKIRTGWSVASRNAVRIARIAEDAGIAALSVHGRTRECGFTGPVEYETIRAVKQSVSVPVTANGDIDSPEKAREVLDRTGADAVMVGRAAQGRPWIFREIRHYLDHGGKLPAPSVKEIREVILEHLSDHYEFYGEVYGVRVARKHLSWYAAGLPGGEAFRHQINRVDSSAAQIASVDLFFDQLAAYDDRLADVSSCRPFDSPVGASWVEEALAA